MTTSELHFTRRITELRALLSECRRWHHGDPWRYGVDTANRDAWQDHENKLAAELDNDACERTVRV